MNRILILLYHRILSREETLSSFKAEDRVYPLKVEEFTKQLEYLYYNKWSTLSVSQLVDHLQDKTSIPEKSVIISFDDGNQSDYTVAFPLLKRYNFKAAFFLTTDFIEKPGFLKTSQILEMSKEGMEFGTHGKSHKFLPSLEEKELKMELRDSKRELEELLEKEIKILSLPGGYNNSMIKKVAMAVGYQGICSSEFWWNDNKTDPLELKRGSLRYGDSLTYFISLVNMDKMLYFKKKLKDKSLNLLKTFLGPDKYFKFWNLYQKIIQKS